MDPWTIAEVKAYEPRAYLPLQRLYREKGYDMLVPSYRAQYLAETVLRLDMTDHDVIMRYAKEHGRAAALNLLEDMVIASHKRLVKNTTENIPDNG